MKCLIIMILFIRFIDCSEDNLFCSVSDLFYYFNNKKKQEKVK